MKKEIITIGLKKIDWNLEELKKFLTEELILQGEQKGYVVDANNLSYEETNDALFVRSTCHKKIK